MFETKNYKTVCDELNVDPKQGLSSSSKQNENHWVIKIRKENSN